MEVMGDQGEHSSARDAAAPKQAASPAARGAPERAAPAASGPPALLSLMALQRSAGNAAVAHLLGPPVQRWPWSPQVPRGHKPLSEYLQKWTDPDWAYATLEIAYKKDGKEGVANLVRGVEAEANRFDPPERESVMKVVVAQRDRLLLYTERFVVSFEADALVTAQSMLTTSETLIQKEMERYGINEGAVKGEAGAPRGMANKAEAAQLMEAAATLQKEQATLINLEIKLDAEFRKKHPDLPGQPTTQAQRDAHRVASREYVEQRSKFDGLFAAYAAKFPILAAYKDNPQGIAALAHGGASPASMAVIAETLKKHLDAIDTTRGNLGTSLKVLTLPGVVAGTKSKHKVAAGSVEAKAVDEEIAKRASDKAMRDLAIGALSISFGIIAAVASGGASLGAAAVYGAAAGGAAVTSAIQLNEHLTEYQAQNAASETDLDKARAISSQEPSLFWLAVDIVAAIADVVGAGAAFRRITAVMREVKEARLAAAAARQEAEAAAAAAERVRRAQAELDAAMGPLSRTTVERVNAELGNVPDAIILNPKNPLSSLGEAGSLANKPGFGVFEAYIPGIPPPAVVKVFPDDPKYAEVFARELAGARVAAETGHGPRFVREVKVGPGKKGIAMEKVRGDMPTPGGTLEDLQDAAAAGDAEAARKVAELEAKAARSASRIWQGTVNDVQSYGDAIKGRNHFIHGDLQGLVDEAGKWRPIDISNVVPLPKTPQEIAKWGDEAACLRRHDEAVARYIKEHLVAAGAKPLPANPPSSP